MASWHVCQLVLGFMALTCCSSISMLCWWKVCLYRTSQQFILVPLLHGVNNYSVSSAVPYSCLLFSMCNACAEIRLFFLMYRVCSLCLVAIELSDCPTYQLLQALHLSLYIPLEFVPVLAILSVSCWCIVFAARRATFKLECLKRLVIFRISGLWYVNVTHFLGCCIVVVGSFCFFVY